MSNILPDKVKSPLNYVGGKHKLLPQILPLFPAEINNFVDLFAGGGNVSVNVKANHIYLNDTQSEVTELLSYIYRKSSDVLLTELDGLIEEYKLSKTNREGFLSIREDYNGGLRTEMRFYALITHAFNYQIRFNQSGGYNMPFGKDRSWFNPSLRKRFVEFTEAIQERSCSFSSKDFREFDITNLGANDLVYCDPPYLISTASYNENGGWTRKHETDLYLLLDDLNSKGIKFALSNVLKHKGNTNEVLTEWSRSYNVHKLNYNYSNSSYQGKNTDKETVEVLITNY